MRGNRNILASIFVFSVLFCDLTAAQAQTGNAEPAGTEPGPDVPLAADQAPAEAETPANAQAPDAAAPAQEAAAASEAPSAVAPVQTVTRASAQTASEPPPPVRVPGRGLRIAGTAVLAGGYGASLFMGIIQMDLGSDEGAYYLIPLAGGFVMGGKAVADMDKDSNGKISAFMVASLPSFVQVAGLTILAFGIGKGEKWKKEQENKAEVSFAPLGPHGSLGGSVAGRF